MKRLFSFLLKLALIAALVMLLADRPGTARIVWHDTVIETSAAFLFLIALIVAMLFYGAFRVGHFIRHQPEIWRLRRELKQLQAAQAHRESLPPATAPAAPTLPSRAWFSLKRR